MKLTQVVYGILLVWHWCVDYTKCILANLLWDWAERLSGCVCVSIIVSSSSSLCGSIEVKVLWLTKTVRGVNQSIDRFHYNCVLSIGMTLDSWALCALAPPIFSFFSNGTLILLLEGRELVAPHTRVSYNAIVYFKVSNSKVLVPLVLRVTLAISFPVVPVTLRTHTHTMLIDNEGDCCRGWDDSPRRCG